MGTVFFTVMKSPLNGGMRAVRNLAAMQPPVRVPANGSPETVAVVARPEGANVIVTTATPGGTSARLQLRASRAAPSISASAAFASNAASAGAAGSSLGSGSAVALGERPARETSLDA